MYYILSTHRRTGAMIVSETPLYTSREHAEEQARVADAQVPAFLHTVIVQEHP
jgi:hypothetical protein